MERTPDPAMSPGYGASGLHTLPAPSGSPDGYDELTVERLRLLVNSISYEARARVFEVEETLVERRAGSEESACGKACDRMETLGIVSVADLVRPVSS